MDNPTTTDVPQTESQAAQPASKPASHTFPDPSITLVEFSEAMGLLLAARTEADSANRRLVLKKVAYVRLEGEGWGATALPELWISQNAEGLFMVVDPTSGKIFRDPSRRRYEVGFLSKEIFDCTIQCLKERNPGPIYELAVVTFAMRPGFGVEGGGLLAPEDYAAERNSIAPENAAPLPPRMEPK